MIPGYLDGFQPSLRRSPLVDATAWVHRSAFWPAFLGTVGRSRSAPGAFNVAPANVGALTEDLERADRWPVFSLPLAQGCRMHIVLRNLEGDAGVDYLFVPPDARRSLRLAAVEGCFRGPGLSWKETAAAATQADPLLRSPERLLLLLPAGGDTDIPASATQTVAAAVTAAGATRHQDEVATQLLNFSQHYWGPCTWAEAGTALICHGKYSYRAPGTYPTSDLRLITDAFQNP